MNRQPKSIRLAFFISDNSILEKEYTLALFEKTFAFFPTSHFYEYIYILVLSQSKELETHILDIHDY